MKTKVYILLSIVFIGGAFALGTLMSFKQAEQPKQTEEYALVFVREEGVSEIIIYTTIGEQPTTLEKILSNEPPSEKFALMNRGIIIKKLNQINAMGFELFSTNRSAEKNVVWSFMFKRKVK